MAEKAEIKLVQGKSYFGIKGMIAGKSPAANNNGYKEGAIEKGNSKGKLFRSLRFLLKTSNENIIPVEVFGMERDTAVFYNKQLKKSAKVAWDKRFVNANNGYELILPEYDLIERINNDFKDGDFVFIKGKIQFSTYTDASNNEKQQTKFTMEQVYVSSEELDFDADTFEETNDFAQDIVITDIEKDTTEKKIFVHAYIINYGEKFVATSFEVDMNTSSAGWIKTLSGLKFGDSLKVKGKIHHKTIHETVSDEWGTNTIKEYKKSLEILGADGASFEAKKYKEEDFVVSVVKEQPVDWSKVAEGTTEAVGALPFNLDE